MEDKIFRPFETRLAKRGAEPKTIRVYRWSIRRFVDWAEEEGHPLDAVPAWAFEDFLYGSGPYSTQRLILAWVRSSYRYAIRRGLPVADPTTEVKLRRPADKQPRVLERDELERIKGGIASEALWTLFHLLAYSGARRVELMRLTWADVDFGKQEVLLNAKRKMRRVPIHPSLAEVLRPQLGPGELHLLRSRVYTGKQVSEGTFHNWMAEMQNGAGFAFGAHDFRRTVATSLDEGGVQESVIDEIMGWAPSSIRRLHYTKVRDARLYPAILTLYGGKPI